MIVEKQRPSLYIDPPAPTQADPTLETLRTLQTTYFGMGVSMFDDLCDIARTLGEDYRIPRRTDLCRVFLLGNVTLLWELSNICFSMDGKNMIKHERIFASVGNMVIDPIIRETRVCNLYRRWIGDKKAAVNVSDKDAVFIPGKWLDNILERLSYAHEILSSRVAMNNEFERLALIKKLQYGKEL